jgi:DNA-binding CsgD family transcriptional regulator
MYGSSLFDGEVPLTPCELEVCCELVKTPMGLKEIAAKLGKSAKTVSVQAASAYQKLSVQSRLELIQRFYSGKEIQVSQVSPRDVVHRIMERLDEIEHLLKTVIEKRSRSDDGPKNRLRRVG